MPKKTKAISPVEIIEWVEQTVSVDSLTPYERNPRKISKDAFSRLVENIKKNGYHQRILATPDFRVIGGHQRIKALEAIGMATVKVLTPDRAVSDAQFRELLIKDNLPFGEFDPEMLAADFSAEELLEWGMPEAWMPDRTVGTEGLTDEDATPELPVTPVTVLGDIWLLGNHRLMCGDATSLDAVEKLMDGKKANMVYTDPPYGIDVVRKGKIGGDKSFGKNGFDGVIKANKYAPIIGDDSIESALAAYEICLILKIKTILLWGGNFYAHKLPPAKCWVIWDKETDGNFGDGEIAWCSADKSIRIFRHKWSGMIKASERGEKRVHPTQKPVALAEWAIDEFSADGKIILDLFLGSGSTLIACEKMGRTCYGMEMSPAYCDVIIKRWQDFTGKGATHEQTGERFNPGLCIPATRKANAKRVETSA